VVGRVAKPHGVHGDVLVEIITDFPERLGDGLRFGVGEDTHPTEFLETHRVRFHKGKWLVSITDVRDRSTVEALRGWYVFLPEQSPEDLPEGYFYEHQLVGLQCRSTDGNLLGEVTGIDPGIGQTRLVVRSGRRESLVPYVPEIVREVDLEGKVVILDPPPGLLDDDLE